MKTVLAPLARLRTSTPTPQTTGEVLRCRSTVATGQRGDVSQLLHAWSGGDEGAVEEIFPLVYDELRSIARNYLRGERRDHTLQPTALVHEAYFRLVDQRSVQWQERAHFFAIAAQTMRRILVDHARRKLFQKRGGGRRALSLTNLAEIGVDSTPEIVALDDCLTELSRIDQRKAEIVELRFFGGLTVEETAEVVGCSRATVTRDWRMAKAWLYRELSHYGVES